MWRPIEAAPPDFPQRVEALEKRVEALEKVVSLLRAVIGESAIDDELERRKIWGVEE